MTTSKNGYTSRGNLWIKFGWKQKIQDMNRSNSFDNIDTDFFKEMYPLQEMKRTKKFRQKLNIKLFENELGTVLGSFLLV